MTLHDVQDVGRIGFVVAYRCHSCGSAVAVEFPTAAQLAAIRYWLNQHPASLARTRPDLPAPAPKASDDEQPTVPPDSRSPAEDTAWIRGLFNP